MDVSRAVVEAQEHSIEGRRSYVTVVQGETFEASGLVREKLARLAPVAVVGALVERHVHNAQDSARHELLAFGEGSKHREYIDAAVRQH